MALNPDEQRVAFNTLRRFIDGTGYGYWVHDDVLNRASAAVVEAVEQWRAGVSAHNPAPQHIVESPSEPESEPASQD